jgi:hypothetical protein
MLERRAMVEDFINDEGVYREYYSEDDNFWIAEQYHVCTLIARMQK